MLRANDNAPAGTISASDKHDEQMLNWFLIQDRLFTFCRIVDSKDFDRLDEVFLPEGTGNYNGHQTQESCAGLIASMHHSLGPGSNCGSTQHNVLNLQVEMVDAGHATSKAYFYAEQYGARRFEGEIWTTWGEYKDNWLKTAAGWRILHRHYTTFFSRGPDEIVTRDS
jgi:hypothetical protein